MTVPLRRAGHGRAADGALVTWSVAEGRRGRRWREVVVDADGAVRSSLLLELDPDGRFSHLELSTATGLLTLHPEPDGTLHGNAVTTAGVRHVQGLPWDPDGIVSLEGSTVTMVAALQPLFRSGSDRSHRPGLVVGLDLSLSTTTWERTSATAEELAARDADLIADAELPVLDAGTTWPLETPD